MPVQRDGRQLAFPLPQEHQSEYDDQQPCRSARRKGSGAPDTDRSDRLSKRTDARKCSGLQNSELCRLAFRAAGLTDESKIGSFQISTATNVWQIFIVSLDDYNRLMNADETLCSRRSPSLRQRWGPIRKTPLRSAIWSALKIKGTVTDFVDNGIDSMQIIPSMYLFVPDFEAYVASVRQHVEPQGVYVNLNWFYGFDLNCDDEVQIRIQDQLTSGLKELSGSDEENTFYTRCEGVAKERAGFYGLYGGLFFLGILLGVVFLFAAVLIIYYKQVSGAMKINPGLASCRRWG